MIGELSVIGCLAVASSTSTFFLSIFAGVALVGIIDLYFLSSRIEKRVGKIQQEG
jgi:hypothetical protein